MTLILRSPAEREWLDAHGDMKVEAVKEFGSGITIREPLDEAAVKDLALHFKPDILADLKRQAEHSLGISSDAPLQLHLQVLGKKDGVKWSLGRSREFAKGDDLEKAFNELTFELPALLTEGKFGKHCRKWAIERKGSIRIRVTFGLLYSQATVKQELQRAAAESVGQPLDVGALVAANMQRSAQKAAEPPKEAPDNGNA